MSSSIGTHNESDSDDQNNTLFSDLKRVFLTRLNRCKRLRGKTWTDWKEFQESQNPEDLTARIFFRKGQFETWLAYYLVKQDINTVRYNKNKIFQADLISKLEKTSSTFRKRLATAVSEEINPEIRERMRNLRPYCPAQSSSSSALVPPADEMIQHEEGGEDITGHNDPVTLNNVHGSSARLVDTAATLQHDHTDPGQSVPVPPLEEATFTCFNADIDAMSHLFDADLYNSIIRNPILTTPGSYVAAISMLFSNFLDADRATCTMKLDIKSDVVTDFALTWFSVPLGIDSCGNRCLKYNHGGSSVTASQEFLFEGCKLDFIHKYFKNDMMEAITKNSVYHDERQRRESTTNCIKMTIPSRASEKAVIHVSLNLLNGTRIKDRLFPQYGFYIS
ncbi:hypothetical protein FPOAC2_14125 [Fusarium poae]